MTESDCVSLPGWSVCVKVCDPSELSAPLLGDEQVGVGWGLPHQSVALKWERS